MKRIALPAFIVAAALFGLSSTASAHPGHGGGPGHSHGNGGYGQSFAPGGCYGGGGGFYPRQRSNFRSQPYQFNNYRYQSYGNGFNNRYHNGFNQSGLRLRSGGLSFGLRF